MVKQIITNIRHPNYLRDSSYWSTWRDTYEGGDDYTQSYLQQFSARETSTEFNARKLITPVPAFAKAAVNDIRNSVFQRMRDILRKGGSNTYTEAVEGMQGGVDLRGSNMNVFMGYQVLTELCVMGRCGVFIDMPTLAPQMT